MYSTNYLLKKSSDYKNNKQPNWYWYKKTKNDASECFHIRARQTMFGWPYNEEVRTEAMEKLKRANHPMQIAHAAA